MGWLPRPFFLVLVVLIFIVGLTNSLTGCSNNGLSLARVFGSFPSAPDSPDIRRLRQAFNARAQAGVERHGQFRHFNNAFQRVRADYIYKTEEKALVDAAIKGIEKMDERPGGRTPAEVAEAALDSMMATLDPHSTYLNPDEFRESQVSTSGQFGGLGIEINLKDGFVHVIAPIEDTPAYRAGIKADDLITHVEGASIKGMTLHSVVKLLRGRPGSDVRVTVRRTGHAPFDVTITRAIIRIQPVKWRTERDIGVIRLAHFIQHSDEALEAAMKAIRKELGSRFRGLVLDLRGNPGGLLSQSVAVADHFLDQGEIVSIRNRQGEQRGFDAEQGDLARGLPVVVLIDRGSASASEIVAGALQDHGRATVLGVRSFGKGSVQTITPLDWDGALRLTTALHYLPSGRSIQGAGVEPDFRIQGKEPTGGSREADQPRALSAEPSAAPPRQARARLSADDCPTAGKDGKDKVLGCALVFLRAGSPENFLSLMAARHRL